MNDSRWYAKNKKSNLELNKAKFAEEHKNTNLKLSWKKDYTVFSFPNLLKAKSLETSVVFCTTKDYK